MTAFPFLVWPRLSVTIPLLQCNCSNLVPRVFSAFKMVARKRPWQTAGRVSPKILEILIVSKWQQALWLVNLWTRDLLFYLLRAAILDAEKTLGAILRLLRPRPSQKILCKLANSVWVLLLLLRAACNLRRSTVWDILSLICTRNFVRWSWFELHESFATFMKRCWERFRYAGGVDFIVLLRHIPVYKLTWTLGRF